MKRTRLTTEEFNRGFAVPFNPLEGTGLAEGSRNQIRLPGGFVPWKGLTNVGNGSRLMRQVGGTWGGLKDIGATQGKGSFFEDIGRSRWFIGAGQPHVQGVDMTGITASTSLKVAIAVNGAYSAANTFTAGLPQPSAPDVAIADAIGVGYTGNINGPISVKLARLRLTTGARSVASTTSAVVNPVNQTIRVTFPLASTGQDYWAIFFTQSGFGGVGLHYRGTYQDSLDIAESVVAAGVVDGVARTLEFDFKDGDLIPEVAYIDDYVPPAGTHAVRLENVMCVLGAFGDSTAVVSSTNPGTVGAISLPNYYESYKPRHLVYFPEQIVDVMARPTDEYAYVGHRDCITALQYVGVRDGPAVRVSMVSPDIGIAKPHNWCQVHGLLYLFQAKGGLVRMRADGSWDYAWSNPIKKFIKDWTADDTIVGSHPDSLSVTVANGGIVLSFSLQTEEWSVPCYLSDNGVSGSVLSCVSTVGRLLITVNNSGTHTAYAWHEGSPEMSISSFTHWQRFNRPVTVMELGIGFDCDSTTNPLVVSVHRNLRTTHLRTLTVTNGSNVVSATGKFDTNHTGDMIYIEGTDVGGSGIDYLIARMTYVSVNEVRLAHPTTGVALNAQANVSNAFAILATQIITYTIPVTGQQHTPPLQEVFVDEAQSMCFGLTMFTNGSGQALSVEALGTGHEASVAKVA